MGKAFRYDLRFPGGGPLLEYGQPARKYDCADSNWANGVLNLAIDRRNGTLLGEAHYGITCWDLETGAPH